MKLNSNLYWFIFFITPMLMGADKVRDYDLGDWLTIKNCNYVTSLCEGRDYVYFGTNGGVIPFHRFDQYEEPAYTVSDGLADDFILSVYYDNSTGYIWAGHRKGISYLSPSGDWWENPIVFNHHQSDIVKLGGNTDDIFAEMSDGSIMRINSFSGNLIELINQHPADAAWSISAIPGTMETEGIYTTGPGYWVKNDGLVQDNDLREFPWNLKYIDSMGKLYGGVLGLGYLVGDERMRRFDIYPTGPLKNFVNTFLLTDEFLWLGSNDDIKNTVIDRSGLSRYNFNDGNWDYFEDELIYELGSGSVSEIDFGNNLLVAGTNEGLSVYEVAENRWRRFSVHDQLFSDGINTVCMDENFILVGTDYGLNILDLSNWRIEKIRLSKTENLVKIYKITHDDEQFWVGTDNGIYALKINDHSLKHFDQFGHETETDQVVASVCYSINSNGSRTVFFGSNFLMMFNLETGKWTDLPHFYGDAFIYDFDIKGDWLWMGTDEGAKLLNITTQFWEEYHISDGLAGEEVMKVIIDGDWVWFGTDRGLTKYNWRKYVIE
ncbi:MAG: hypothetical protein JXQ65_03115 [Candidatus Marinimicrobia bacterium]|nr:hypothetical protein [Candidatus Neomarinimicrobiota bacterium]